MYDSQRERQQMIRPPAVAGQFYPGGARAIDAALDELIPSVLNPRPAIALVCPHAGWVYSGATAGKAYACVRVPDRVVLFGPNHHGIGSRYALYKAGLWRMPNGDVPIAEALATELLDGCALLSEDPRAHAAEHSLEVQVPMLRRVNPHVQIVPILIGAAWPESGGRRELRELGEAIATVVKQHGKPVLLVASTDLNHYEDQQTSHRKDKLALEAVRALDPDGLMDCVTEHDISMCGVAPVYVVLVASKRLGARRAEVIDYRTSGDVSGDLTAVVGYGAIVIE